MADLIFALCMTAFGAIFMHHIDATNDCLAGAALDAKIQQNFLNTATPTEKDQRHD